MALYDRMKEKDAWDIYFCVREFSDDREALVAEFRQVLDHPLVIEGLAKIRSKFRAVDKLGPVFVVAFEELDDRDERERVQRDAFERVNELLDYPGIAAFEDQV